MKSCIKKCLCAILMFAMLLCLCACESPQEKANRKIAEANAAYAREKAKLDLLEDELEYVQWQIEQAEKNR